MVSRRRPVVRGLILAACIVAASLVGVPAPAASRDEAGQTASSFLSRFLDGDDAGAARGASGDLDAWRTILERHLPGQGEFTGYRVLEVKGSSRARRAVARIERGEASDLFYLDFNALGKIARFYTIDEALAPLIDELKRITAEITSLELTPDSHVELERLMAEQHRVASRIKNLLWRHRKLLESADLAESSASP